MATTSRTSARTNTPLTTPGALSVSEALSHVRGVDTTGVKARTAKLWSRSIKNESQATALRLAVTMTDLTTLEGSDTPGRVHALCVKAATPDASNLSVPPVAAVCVYSDRIAAARSSLDSLGPRAAHIEVASVAGAFPSGRTDPQFRYTEIADAAAQGADEIDMVIDRAAMLDGNYQAVYDDVIYAKHAAGTSRLKAILEVGELGTLDNVVKASWLAMAAGADFIKTSTGKVTNNASPETVLVMLEAAREFAALTSTRIGVKAAGGIRSAKDAVRYLVLVAETAGPDWLDPFYFRFGASALLNDLVAQIRHLETGIYTGDPYVSIG
jgi:deoxyribose-phosphate aldolase